MTKLEKLKEDIEKSNICSQKEIDDLMVSIEHKESVVKIKTLEGVLDKTLSCEDVILTEIKNRLENSKDLEKDLLFIIDNYNLITVRDEFIKLFKSYKEELELLRRKEELKRKNQEESSEH